MTGCAGGGSGSASNTSSTTTTGTTPVATGSTLAITAVSPTSVPVGSGDLLLTVTGTGFVSGNTVQVNGVAEQTTFVSATQLTATVPSAQLQSSSVLPVAVSNGSTTVKADPAAVNLSVNNPAPVITTLAPSTLLAGSDATTVAITGSGFLKSSTVQVNGTQHASTYVSATEVDVPFAATELASSGTFAVTVANAQPGGGTSAGASIPVNNPVPVIAALSPTNIATGASDTTVAINGTGFLPITTLQVDGTARPVSYVSNKQLSVKFAAADLTKIVTYNLNLTNAGPGGGTSAATPLYIGYPSPVITSLSPSTLPIGSAATTLTVNGTGFLASSTVQFLGTVLPTTYVSSTQLTAVLPATSLTNDGTYPVYVVNPATSGGTSKSVSFVVQAKTPVATAVSPSSLVVNGGPYTINVTGTNLTGNSKILWNGTQIPTTSYATFTYTSTGYVTSYALDGTVSNDLVSSVGSASVTVSTASASPAVSNALTVSIANPPVPTVTSLSPNYAPVNADVKLSVTGTGFTKNSVASYNGTALTTTFNSTTSLSATVPASLVAFPGNNAVTVNTPAPGGGTSTGTPLTIYLPVVSNNMVFNKVNGLAYLSIPSTGSTVAGNSIVSLDPATGALGTPIFVGSEPGVMAVSDDGKSLWVALNGTVAIRKVDLTTNTAGAQYSVSAFGTSAITAMLVLPSTTDSVAATNSSLLAVYDAGVLRGSTVSVNSAYALQADSSRSELYAGGSSAVQTYTYATSGLTLKASNNSTNYSNSVASSTFDEIQLANGKVFTDYGRIYDAESSGLLGSFTLQTTSGTTTSTTTPTGPTFYDASLSQVYVLNNGSSYNYGAYSQVSLFNQSDYSNLNKSFGWNIPYYIYTANTTQYLNPHRLTRWGSNGLLLHTKYAIFTAQSNVVKDQSGVSADLSVAVQSSGGITTGSTGTYTVTIKNAGPQAATDVALSLVPPTTGVITSTTSTNGTCTSQTGCTFGTLNSGSSATATVSVLQTTAGTGALAAYVQASSTDPDMSNNSASGSVVVTGNAYNLSPTLSALSPNAIKAGSSNTILTVNGSNFASNSQVMLGSTALTTTFVSSTQLTATVPAASLTGLTWANVSVSSPAPGGGTSGSLPLTVFNVVTVGLNHIVYEPYSRKLYASVSSGSSTVTGSSVVSIDPATATFGTPVTFSTAPNVVALSSSGNTLYTALTQSSTSNSTATLPLGRVDLTTGSSTSPVATLSSYYYSGYTLQQLAVQSGSETTLALALPYSYTSLYDYDVAGKTLKQRGSNSTIYNASCSAFLDPSDLLVSGNYSSDSILPVTSAGFGTAKTLSNLTECFQLSGATLATPTGKIFNVTSSAATQLGSVVLPSTSNYTSSPAGTFTLDASLGNAYFAANTQNTNYYGSADGLVSYDLQSFLRTGSLSLNIPTIEGSSSYNTSINDVVRWGQDGLALVTSTGHLYLLRGPFVVPQELTSNTAAALSSSSSTTLTAGSGNTLLTLTGTNFVPGVAVTWNGSYRTTNRISATQVTVAIPAADLTSATTGKLVATNPNATASNTLTVSVQ